jgi:hypothetical protein
MRKTASRSPKRAVSPRQSEHSARSSPALQPTSAHEMTVVAYIVERVAFIVIAVPCWWFAIREPVSYNFLTYWTLLLHAAYFSLDKASPHATPGEPARRSALCPARFHTVFCCCVCLQLSDFCTVARWSEAWPSSLDTHSCQSQAQSTLDRGTPGCRRSQSHLVRFSRAVHHSQVATHVMLATQFTPVALIRARAEAYVAIRKRPGRRAREGMGARLASRRSSR